MAHSSTLEPEVPAGDTGAANLITATVLVPGGSVELAWGGLIGVGADGRVSFEPGVPLGASPSASGLSAGSFTFTLSPAFGDFAGFAPPADSRGGGDLVLTTLALGEEGDPDSLPESLEGAPSSGAPTGERLEIGSINGQPVSAGDTVELGSGGIVTVAKGGQVLIFSGDLLGRPQSQVALAVLSSAGPLGDGQDLAPLALAQQQPFFDISPLG